MADSLSSQLEPLAAAGASGQPIVNGVPQVDRSLNRHEARIRGLKMNMEGQSGYRFGGF